MTDIGKKLGEQVILSALSSDLAGQALATALGPIIGTYATGIVVAIYGSDTEDHWRQMLSLIVGAVPSGSDSAHEVESERLRDCPKDIAQMIVLVARFFAIVEEVTGEEEADTVDKNIKPGKTSVADWKQQAIELLSSTTEVDAKDIDELVNGLVEPLSETSKMFYGMAVAPLALSNPKRVLFWFRLMFERWVAIFPHLEKYRAYFEAELIEYVERWVIAKSISKATKAFKYNIRSNLKLGRRVHRLVQRRYRSWNHQSHELGLEQWQKAIRLEVQVVNGPITRGRNIPIDEFIASGDDKTGFWTTLRMACNGKKLSDRSWLRADLVDKDTPGAASIWEIKPTLSAPAGVWQEATIKIYYNVIRLAIHGALPNEPAVIPHLQSGRALSSVSRRSRKEKVADLPISILNPIDVSKEADEPAVACPFTLSILPGLVLYVVFRSSDITDKLLALAALMEEAMSKGVDIVKGLAKRIAEAFGEAIEEAEKIIEQIGSWLPSPEAVLSFVMTLVTLLIVFIFSVLTLPMRATGGFLLAPSDPTRRRPGADPLMAALLPPKSLKDLVPQSLDQNQNILALALGPKKTTSNGTPTGTFTAGPVRITGIPEEAMADFVGYFFNLTNTLLERGAGPKQTTNIA